MNEKITELEQQIKILDERLKVLEKERSFKFVKAMERVTGYDSFCQHISQKFSGQFVPNHVILEEYLKMFPRQARNITSNTLNKILRYNQIIELESKLIKVHRKTLRHVKVK